MPSSALLARIAALPQAQDRGRPLGGLLLDGGAVAPDRLLDALGEAEATGAPIDRVLQAHGLATPDACLRARGRHHGLPVLDRDTTPPCPSLAGLIPPETCLAMRVLPWMVVGETLVVAGARPEDVEAVRPLLAQAWPQIMPALASERDIEAELAARHGRRFARAAESNLPADESCRDLNLSTPGRRIAAGGAALACVAALALAPTMFFAGAFGLALAAIVAGQLLKLAAAVAAPRAELPAPLPAQRPTTPVVSLLVPLFREAEIAGTLVRRLERLSWPKAALDVVLVLEAGDEDTRRALARADLPAWARVIEVPPGGVTTKPRALNYALPFARGEIVGILDAEDAPAADQIDRVAARFAVEPSEVACLQGILDFYNPQANWLSRMFTLEYAAWFRMILPGLARLGFAIPLGGTTIYFRRAALEAVGGWDAHNVTEDADLGMRLARHGYRTALVPTFTLEEANCRLWPWVRQRSRWLKGYMMTWAAHSRRPGRLLRDMGGWKTAGMQVLFLGTILQALLAPLMWSFWIVLIGIDHPVAAALPPAGFAALVAVFLASEAVTLGVAFAALARTPHRGLGPWVPTLAAYMPLIAVAGYKALWEAIRKPFFWDKTAHGRSAPDHALADQKSV
ncbi:Glycosyltransferase, catalytic subunit of cellulose synthase and poly-beta-1,6-N-acetylglucosamine synthase [Roseivivax marinus]|uniref:glycosyltransferase family 2 protein n=1 Tax=Roseivivax marinus TaxID=1379903 RepID=UPI0008CEA1BD|nr:glycosyltransferase family 2 protein [Roseivivax marinus]SEL58646.1 Glycosyltransferase, catalytic subunit of cellulose synthase and poly-beta-1,6-N-acetylglucosamine synthase [Roseivivax marinus]